MFFMCKYRRRRFSCRKSTHYCNIYIAKIGLFYSQNKRKLYSLTFYIKKGYKKVMVTPQLF